MANTTSLHHDLPIDVAAEYDSSRVWGRRDADSSTDLVEDELEWRVAPPLQTLPNGRGMRIGLSRWRNLQVRAPIEVSSDGEDDFHVITVLRRRTKAELFIEGKQVWRGGLPDQMFLTGPRRGRWRKIFHASYDQFRIYLPQGLIAECIESILGRHQSGVISLFETSSGEDEGLRHIAQILSSIEAYDSVVRPCFADTLGLALASRLVSLHYKATGFCNETSATASANPHLERVLGYIEEHLGTPIYLAELSDIAGLSRIQFVDHFRAKTGYTPYSYILHRRVVRAQEMLRKPGATIVGVALDLGFSSQAHFTGAFRKAVGVTPGEWRGRSV